MTDVFTSAMHSVSGIKFYFSCSKTLKLKYVTVLNFCDLSKLIRKKENARQRFVSLDRFKYCL